MASEIDFGSIHVGADILKGVEVFRSSDEEEQSPKPQKRKNTAEVNTNVPTKRVTRDSALDITMDSLVQHVTGKKKPFDLCTQDARWMVKMSNCTGLGNGPFFSFPNYDTPFPPDFDVNEIPVKHRVRIGIDTNKRGRIKKREFKYNEITTKNVFRQCLDAHSYYKHEDTEKMALGMGFEKNGAEAKTIAYVCKKDHQAKTEPPKSLFHTAKFYVRAEGTLVESDDVLDLLEDPAIMDVTEETITLPFGMAIIKGGIAMSDVTIGSKKQISKGTFWLKMRTEHVKARLRNMSRLPDVTEVEDTGITYVNLRLTDTVECTRVANYYFSLDNVSGVPMFNALWLETGRDGVVAHPTFPPPVYVALHDALSDDARNAMKQDFLTKYHAIASETLSNTHASEKEITRILKADIGMNLPHTIFFFKTTTERGRYCHSEPILADGRFEALRTSIQALLEETAMKHNRLSGQTKEDREEDQHAAINEEKYITRITTEVTRRVYATMADMFKKIGESL